MVTTVQLPDGLAENVQEFVDGDTTGQYGTVTEFVREATRCHIKTLQEEPDD